jgi:Kae1-associated kinase Bud32
VENNKILYRGAEAEICYCHYLGNAAVQKRRVSKQYRIEEIDKKLISSRTKEEAKLISESRRQGVSVPTIYDVDLQDGVITMEYINGERIKDILNNLSERKMIKICKMIGESIAKLHNGNIIHGDITTSNMILFNDRIHFIDFGLGEKNGETESQGVDLHVLMEAIDSTHSNYSDCFKYVIEGYSKKLNKDASQVLKKIDEIVKRGRYR